MTRHDIDPDIRQMLPQLTQWRQDLHAHPEIAFEEVRTSQLVQERLKSFGDVQIHTGFAKTGVVGVLKNGNSSKKIGFRADMDALPIYEENDLPYNSTYKGKMHACGHDGHTTILLGVAQYLAKHKPFDGTVYFYFQPAEEGGGGANVMIQEGLFDKFRPDEVYALHNFPGQPIGTISYKSGVMWASPDGFTLNIKGVGGHAAMPHACVDPVYVALQIGNGLQAIASRQTDPLDSIVVSITQINAGKAHNVIPSNAQMAGTVRTMQPSTRDFAQHQVHTISENIAKAYGAEVEVIYKRMYPPTINDEQATRYAKEAAIAAVGESNTVLGKPSMGGEDFSYMLEQVPGCMIGLGNGDSYGLHHPQFNFCDEAIPYGMQWYINLAKQRLPLSA